MKKILPVIWKEILKPVAANLLRSLANKLAGRKKKSVDTCDDLPETAATSAADLSTN